MLVSWRAATRYVVLPRHAPRIQCLQEEDAEGSDSDEEEEGDEEELEESSSLPSVDDLDGARDIGILEPFGACLLRQT